MISLNRKFVWVFFILVSTSFLSGCIENSNSEDLQFQVEANLDGLKVVEIYEETVLIETLSATMTFDFSSLQGQDIEVIGLTVGNYTISTDEPASDEWRLDLSLENHGLYQIEAFAVSSEVTYTQTLTAGIDLEIVWTENNTNEPSDIEFNPVPQTGEYADYFLVNSSITNPESILEFGQGQSVDFTWLMIEPSGDSCQSQSGTADNGATSSWETIHFNTLEPHSLRVSYDEGQDRIDVRHVITVGYSTD